MEFNVSQIMKGNQGTVKTFELSEQLMLPTEQSLRKDPIFDSSFEIYLTGTVTMLRTDAGIWTTAPIDCETSCFCSMCLQPHIRHISFTINEEYYPLSRHLKLTEIDESQFISNENILDLLPPIREHVSLKILINPICSEDCADICVDCGLNLNQGHCASKNKIRRSMYSLTIG